MTANVLSRIFTIEIGDTPTLMFEAQNMREAQELCHEQWLKDDLAEAKSDGAPLWDGTAKLRARMARPDESALFAEAKNNGQPSDGLMLVYLVFEILLRSLVKRDPEFYLARFLDPISGGRIFSAHWIIAVPTVIALLFIVDHMLVENVWS
jgi:hypothetical protein